MFSTRPSVAVLATVCITCLFVGEIHFINNFYSLKKKMTLTFTSATFQAQKPVFTRGLLYSINHGTPTSVTTTRVVVVFVANSMFTPCTLHRDNFPVPFCLNAVIYICPRHPPTPFLPDAYLRFYCRILLLLFSPPWPTGQPVRQQQHQQPLSEITVN